MQTLRARASDLSPQGHENMFHMTSLYEEFLSERDEILRHKWIESERVGHDIGFEKALLDWLINHQADWRASRRTNNRPEIFWGYTNDAMLLGRHRKI